MPDDGSGALADDVTRAARLGCVRPVRLVGGLRGVDPVTGQERTVYDSRRDGDGQTLIPCGDRRDSVCPSCAEIYRRDAWHVVAAGLQGRTEEDVSGRGVAAEVVPASVQEHPRLFVTLTAPSFGVVHAARDGRRCRPRRNGGTCVHGRPAGCSARHAPGDAASGTALCVDCYDYHGQVLFNACAGELWRRTVIAVRRALAARVGVGVRRLGELLRVSYAKVAEGQQRGVVHFHAVFRLDGVAADGTATVVAPPAWAGAELLAGALRDAVPGVAFDIPTHDGGTRTLAWGTQTDIRTIGGGGDGANPRTIAAYIAKYATKAVAAGIPALSRRLTSDDIHHLGWFRLSAHARRLVWAAWNLARFGVYRHLKLRRWAHQYGMRGHVQTKSRNYGVTFGYLRKRRHDYRISRDSRINSGEVLVGSWRYAGSGYVTNAEREFIETRAQLEKQLAYTRETAAIHWPP